MLVSYLLFYLRFKYAVVPLFSCDVKHTHTQTLTHVNTHAHKPAHTCIHPLPCVHIHIHRHAYTYSYIHTHTDTSTHDTHIHKHTPSELSLIHFLSKKKNIATKSIFIKKIIMTVPDIFSRAMSFGRYLTNSSILCYM